MKIVRRRICRWIWKGTLFMWIGQDTWFQSLSQRFATEHIEEYEKGMQRFVWSILGSDPYWALYKTLFSSLQVSRSANKMADCLAKQGIDRSCTCSAPVM